ncbi:DNA-binding protein YbaB [Nocardia sp. GAS34]|jgi:DNA-binding protein YbaB|uniref:YbaB/EbfC family nucleoid-associated protein n=1 Tax=unclassified Nocardia TaxID=2637762 RepID=UPI003D1DEE28
MANEALKAQVAELMKSVQDYAAATARARERREQLMVTAEAADGRVSVTVNADGVVIDVQFADDVDDLDYGEIAAAVRVAAQDAAAAAVRESAEITDVTSLARDLPGFSEILPGLPDFDQIRTMFPPAPRAPTDLPGSPSRTAPQADRQRGNRSEVNDSQW